jgi:ABC-2 type transport system ATP-binding protein
MTAIEVRDLRKTFAIPRNQVHTLKERALHPFRRTEHDVLHVLDGISFDVQEGEFFGIVGRNGSGKSTLLKCIAGIYQADSGSIAIAGRLAPFIELGVGFNPDLTSRENVVINAVMMGLSPREARARFDDVIAFAELEDFVDLKLKNYSSGMQVRLAFSVMVQSDTDILLIDEVLAVGDAAFQQKCLDVFDRLKAEGKTIVLVTHDVGMVERFCHRAMMVSAGEIDTIGDPRSVGRRYLQLNFAEHIGLDFGGIDAPAAGIREVHCTNAAGERIDAQGYGEPLQLHAVVEAHEPIEHPLVELWIADGDGHRAFVTTTREASEPPGPVRPGERLHVVVELENRLAAGRWFVGCAIKRGSRGVEIVTLEDRAADLLVYGQHPPQGPMWAPHTVAVARATEPATARSVTGA